MSIRLTSRHLMKTQLLWNQPFPVSESAHVVPIRPAIPFHLGNFSSYFCSQKAPGHPG